MDKRTSAAILKLKEARLILDISLTSNHRYSVIKKLDSLIAELGANNKKLELLNYEGPVLSLIRSGDQFVFEDQWGAKLATASRSEVIAFVTGEIKISDSKGTQYFYPEHSIDAKPKPSDLDSFLYGE